MPEQLHIPRAKITPPRLAVPLLPRPRLHDAVRSGAERRLVVLSAEAGYGKTALLLSVLPALDLPTAWVTLDPADADLNLFAAAVAASVARVAPDVPALVDRLLTTGPNPSDVRALLLRLFDDAPPLVVILDDFHTVEHNPEVLDLVDALLAHLPAHLHIILATRTWPRLGSLPRLLVQGEATTLDKTQLRFTPEEVAQALRVMDVPLLPDDGAESLARRAEGWPAAIHLAALAARTRGPEALARTPREVFDFLAASVLETLEPDVLEFLLRTSILAEFTPALCRALVPSVEPGPMLAEIERRNLFLYRLDDVGPRYRYHQLFAEVLGQRLGARGAAEVASLHHAAAKAYEAEAIPDQAVRHFFAAGALDEAERVMKPLHGDRLTAPLAYSFRDLISRLTPEVLDRHPWMTRCGASSARFVGDYQLGLAFSRRSLAASEGRDPDLWTFSIHGVGVMLGHLDRHDEAAAVCEEALRHLAPNVEPRFRGGVIADLLDAYLHLGRVADAARLLPELEGILIAGTQLGKSYGLAFYSAAVAAARMQYGRARELYQDTITVGEERGSMTQQLWGWLGVLQVEVARHRLGLARDALQRAQGLHDATRERASELTLSTLSGDVQALAGAYDEATDAYGQTLAAVRDTESQEPRILAQLGLARVSRAQGRTAQAEALIREATVACERARLGGLLPRLRLTQISLLHALDEPDAARAILAPLRTTFEEWGATAGSALTALWAVALDRAKKVGGTLRPALELAARAGDDVVPHLAEEARWTAPLLIRALATRTEPAAARDLLVAMEASAVDALVAALDDPAVRTESAAILGQIGDPRARRPLRAAAAQHPEMRAQAQHALARLREPEPVMLAVRMLGSFEVRRDTVAIPDSIWKTQHVKALLKYLLLHRHRTVSQDELIELLWPDVDPATGAGRLKSAVKTLRQALEPMLEGTRSSFIVRSGAALRFTDAGRCGLDLDEYDALLADARAHEEAGRPAEAAGALERARSLYRGDLLEDDRYEDWAAQERERRRERHLEALETLAALHAGRRDFRRAGEAIRQVLAMDRLRESAYCQAIQFALARGDRDAALRAFQTCERLLREELGVAPQPETMALGQAARTPTPA